MSVKVKAAVILSLLSLCTAAPVLSPAAGQAGDEKKIDTVSNLPRKARLALFNSQKAAEEGNFKQSCDLLLNFLSENPDDDHYIIRFYLGTYLVKLDRNEEALDNYRKSVELEPRFEQGWLNLGEMAYQMERYDLAASSILKGFELGTDKRSHLLYYAAAAYIMAGKPLKAADLLEELVSGKYGELKLEWYRALLSACLDSKAISRGEKSVKGMIGQFAGDPDAWKLAFQFHAGSGDYRQAAVELTIAGYLRPLEPDELVQLGDMYNAIGVPAQASAYYSEAIADTSSARDFEKLASAYLAAYDFEAALATLERALSRKPTVRLWALLGDLHYMDGNHEKAYQAFKKCIELDSEYGRAYLMMGYCSLEMGDVNEAVNRLNAATGFPEYKNTALKLLKRAEIVNN